MVVHGGEVTPNPSIERTCPGKPGHASHVKRYVYEAQKQGEMNANNYM